MIIQSATDAEVCVQGNHYRRFLISAVALTLVTGCAGNVLRIEGAEAVGKAASSFTTSANAALDDAKARRMQANATLVASDPSCEPQPAINIYVPNGSDFGENPPPAPPLCVTAEIPPKPVPKGYSVQKIKLEGIPDEALKPTVLLIGAVGDYGAALTKIVERPNTDIGKELASLAAKASEAQTIANGLLGLNIPNATKVLATNQAKTAMALLQFASDLAEEQEKVNDIRGVVDERGDAVMATIPDLKEQLKNWTLLVAQGDAQVVQNSLVRAYNVERGSMGYERRLTMVQTITNARSDALAYPARHKALNTGLDMFVAAEKDMRRLLSGNFTKAERQRIARINEQRMLEAFGLMAKAITAFGGL